MVRTDFIRISTIRRFLKLLKLATFRWCCPFGFPFKTNLSPKKRERKKVSLFFQPKGAAPQMYIYIYKSNFGGRNLSGPGHRVLGIDDGHQVVAGQVPARGQAREAAADDQHAAPQTPRNTGSKDQGFHLGVAPTFLGLRIPTMGSHMVIWVALRSFCSWIPFFGGFKGKPREQPPIWVEKGPAWFATMVLTHWL